MKTRLFRLLSLTLSISFAIWLTGCANVGFQQGSTSLTQTSLVFGRIVLDKGNGPEALSTMSTAVVIRDIESAEEPGLVTQPMEKDGRFYWSLAPGRYQLTLVLNRFPDGYRAYNFNVPKIGEAYYFGDLILRGDHRFDTLGGANVRNVRAELQDATPSAVTKLKENNPQLGDIKINRLALRDMTRPSERAQAYADALAAVPSCCRSLSELGFEVLRSGDKKSFEIGPASPVFDFQSGRSRFLALKLPESSSNYTLSLRSSITPSNLAGAGRAYIFAPALLRLDKDFKPLPGQEDGWFMTVPASLMPPRPVSIQATLTIQPGNDAPRYLVLYTTPAILAEEMKSWRPGFVGVPGGALPTGMAVQVIMEPTISGEIEVAVPNE